MVAKSHLRFYRYPFMRGGWVGLADPCVVVAGRSRTEILMDYLFYIASAVGALAVYLMMPTQRSSPRYFGALLGLLALAGTLGFLVNQFPLEKLPNVYFYVFTALAVACAVRVITHSRPVYSALFFVMVVLAVSGLFVILEAEFMAFAMIIIYAGAILVTYLFVIMLATLPQVEGEQEQSPLYDRVAREPFSAVVLGFALIAVLTNVMFRPGPRGGGERDSQAGDSRAPRA